MSSIEQTPVTYTRHGAWHALRCPSVDPKLVVVDRFFNSAVLRAEQLFGITIPESKEAA